jgi:PKD repeat protein
MNKKAFSILFLIILVIFPLVTSCGLPKIALTIDNSSGGAPLLVKFKNGTQVKPNSGIIFDWDFGDGKKQIGASAADSINHEYTVAGNYTVTLTEYNLKDPAKTNIITQNILVTHGTLSQVNIIPEKVVLNIGDTQAFTSQAFDDYGNRIPEALFSWLQGNAGTVTSGGIFTAGTIAGNFTDGVYGVAELNGISVNKPPLVVIKPDPLYAATLDTLSIAAGESKQLLVVGKDKYGNKLTDLETTWSIEDPQAGTITQDGLFTASRQAVSYNHAIKVIVKQSDKTIEATAKVNIIPGTLSQLGIAPAQINLGQGMTQQFVVAGADKYGNRVSNISYTWSCNDAAGTVSSSGLFTASKNVGNYRDAVTITAKSGDVEINKTAVVNIEKDKILFISNKSDTTSFVYHAYSMDVDGNNIKSIDLSLDGEIEAFDASYDGRRIVYCDFTWDSDGYYINDYTWLSNTDGSWPMSITSGTHVHVPSISPDGKKIVYAKWVQPVNQNTSGYEIYIMDIDGGNEVNLTNNTVEDYYPSWSPDGRQIVFRSFKNSSYPKVWVMNSDGSNAHQVNMGTGWDSYPRWSPDGNYIVFASGDVNTGKYSLCVMNTDGTNKHVITGTSYNSECPYWSPDSSKIIFTSDKTDAQYDLYSVNRDGTSLTRLTDTTANDIFPVWLMPKQGVEVSSSSVVINENFSQPQMTAQQISDMAKDAVVRLEVSTAYGTGYGSGFVIRSNGVILTANHVISGADEITVYLQDGTTLSGTVLARDTIRDLALVKVQTSGLPVIEIGSLSSVDSGQQVVVLGYPLGNKNVSVTSGLVSSIEFDDGINTTWIQTDSAVNPGNSGGPMLDMYGKVIGLITRKVFGIGIEGIGYAISADTLSLYLPKLLDEAGIT